MVWFFFLRLGKSCVFFNVASFGFFFLFTVMNEK